MAICSVAYTWPTQVLWPNCDIANVFSSLTVKWHCRFACTSHQFLHNQIVTWPSCCVAQLWHGHLVLWPHCDMVILFCGLTVTWPFCFVVSMWHGNFVLWPVTWPSVVWPNHNMAVCSAHTSITSPTTHKLLCLFLSFTQYYKLGENGCNTRGAVFTIQCYVFSQYISICFRYIFILHFSREYIFF